MPVTARSLPREGAQLSGRYVLGRRIGEGAMGVVYEAVHGRLGHRVAVKMLRPEVLANAEIVARFEREGRLASQLTSRHACRILDVDSTDEGLPFLIMEYLEGIDLAVEIQRKTRLDVGPACEVVRQAASGLAEAHELGIVHRDLKPQNIFLARSRDDALGWVAKVLDFGISKSGGPEAHTTMTQLALGTPLYMSPEQVRSAKRVDARSDVWALGVVLFESLAGIVPFPGESATSVAAAIVADEPLPLASLRPDLPAELVAIVARALTKDASRRIASANELRLLLEPFAMRPSALSISGDVPRPSLPDVPLAQAGASSTSSSGVQPSPRVVVPAGVPRPEGQPSDVVALDKVLGDEATELPPTDPVPADDLIEEVTAEPDELDTPGQDEGTLESPTFGPLPPPRLPPPRLASLLDTGLPATLPAQSPPEAEDVTSAFHLARSHSAADGSGPVFVRGGTVPLHTEAAAAGVVPFAEMGSPRAAHTAEPWWTPLVRRARALDARERGLLIAGVASTVLVLLVSVIVLAGGSRGAEVAPTEPVGPAQSSPGDHAVPSPTAAAPVIVPMPVATVDATAEPKAVPSESSAASAPSAVAPAKSAAPPPQRPPRTASCPAAQKILVRGKLVCPR